MGKAMVLASLHHGTSITEAVAMQSAMVLMKSRKLQAIINQWWGATISN